MLRKNRAQGTLEYAMIIAVVVAALLAIQVYMKRGVQGKLRESTDQIGQQYSAGKMTSNYTTEQIAEMKTKETFGLEGTAFTQGVSNFTVVTPSAVTRKAEGTSAEKVTQTLNEEVLFP